MGYGEGAGSLSDGDDLRDNLVGLDDADAGARAPYAQTLTFTDVTERGALDGGAFQLYWFENGYWRDGAGGTRPFYFLQDSVR